MIDNDDNMIKFQDVDAAPVQEADGNGRSLVWGKQFNADQHTENHAEISFDEGMNGESYFEQIAADLHHILTDDLNEKDLHQAIQQLIRVFHNTEKQVLRSISLYLCELSDIPRSIINYLAQNSFTVAEPIIQKSPDVDENMMLQIIHMKSAEFWRVMALRHDLTAQVVETLASCQDVVTSEHLLDNDDISISDRAFDYCYELSKGNHSIASKMSVRPEIPQHMAVRIYWQVSQRMRKILMERHNIPERQLNEAFKAALVDFNDMTGNGGEYTPTPLMWELAFKYKKQSKITPAIMVKTLHDGRTRFFMAMMSVYTGIHYDVIYKAISKGRIFALICKANGFSKEQFVSSYLKARGSIYSRQAINADEVHRVIRVFDRLSHQKAQAIISRRQNKH